MTDNIASEIVRELEAKIAALRAKLEAEQQPKFQPGDVLRWEGDSEPRFMSGRGGECHSSGTGYGDPNGCPDQYTKIATLKELVEFWEQHADLRTKRKPLSECVDAEDIVRHYKGVKLRPTHWWQKGEWVRCEEVYREYISGRDDTGNKLLVSADSLIKNGEIYHD